MTTKIPTHWEEREMIVNFTPEKMARLRSMVNSFNRMTGLQISVNDYVALLVDSAINRVSVAERSNVDAE